MKKLLLVTVSLLCVFAFVSCDIAATLDSVSNMIHDYATGIGGPYLEETESTVPSSSSSSEEAPSEPSSTSSSSSSEESTTTSSSSSSEEPPAEPEPPVEPLPERPIATFGQMLGINIDSKLPAIGDKTSVIYDHMFKHRPYFGTFRVYEDIETGVNTNEEGEILNTSAFTYSALQKLLLDIKFADYIAPIEEDDSDQEDPEGTAPEAPDPETPDPENPDPDENGQRGESVPFSEEEILAKTYLDIANSLYEYSKKYADFNNMGYNTAEFELGRHPDKHLSAEEYALLISYAYDANGKDVENAGVIAGHKDAKIVMGALSEPNLQYIQDMMDALSTLREGERPVFVGAFNTEAFVPSIMTPEGYYLDEDSDFYQMIKYRDENYNHVEFHVSAFGYNTLDTTSDHYASEEWQANYMVRSYLIFAGLGVDSAYAYALQDKTGAEYNGYGIIKEDGTAKKAQYYLFNTRRLLAGSDYRFKSSIENAQGAMIYEFEDSQGKRILAVWNPVSDDSVLDDVQIATQTEGTLVRLTSFNEYTFGINDTLTPEDGFVKVDASATPVFILFE
ncbi:MAG: hypothetical protein E7622_04235 [Ruminococcaceae bacterium]|nr:hypothetical protein [Oscillospiraceae bacterium]